MCRGMAFEVKLGKDLALQVSVPLCTQLTSSPALSLGLRADSFPSRSDSKWPQKAYLPFSFISFNSQLPNAWEFVWTFGLSYYFLLLPKTRFLILFLMFFNTTRVIFLKHRPDTFSSRSQRLLIDSYCEINECLIAKDQANLTQFNWSQFLAFFSFCIIFFSHTRQSTRFKTCALFSLYLLSQILWVHLKCILPYSPCWSS